MNPNILTTTVTAVPNAHYNAGKLRHKWFGVEGPSANGLLRNARIFRRFLWYFQDFFNVFMILSPSYNQPSLSLPAFSTSSPR